MKAPIGPMLPLVDVAVNGSRLAAIEQPWMDMWCDDVDAHLCVASESHGRGVEERESTQLKKASKVHTRP